MTKKTKKKVTKKKVTKKKTVTHKKHKTFKFEYAPALESTSVVKLESKYGHFINGNFVDPINGKYFDTNNPSNGKKLSKLALGSKEDVDLAVKSAKKAYDQSWSKLSGQERGKYLFRIARLIQERAREFAVLETMDGGKPIKESRDVDIPLAAAHFFYYAGWADKLDYAFPGKSVKSLGVVGQIIPWNFPLLMAAWKIAPALATGNTVVLKPAEQTSLTALLLAKVIQDAGLPDGVVNIVTGAGETGACLVDHPLVKKIAFTGSTHIGKSIAEAISDTEKKVTLELGGKSAHIIYEDAAIDQAVEGIVQGIFFNQGHVCCAGSRLLVEESIAPIIEKKLKQRMTKLRVGDPLDKNTDIGAINSKEQLDKIKSLVSQGIKEGGTCWSPDSALIPKSGYYFAPTLFTNVTSSHSICREEIFGPVISMMTFRTPEEAIAKANDTEYGLAAGIWSDKGSKIFKTAGELKAGVVWTNSYNKFDPTSPFGGYKESGIGREGGVHGLFPYVEIL